MHLAIFMPCTEIYTVCCCKSVPKAFNKMFNWLKKNRPNKVKQDSFITDALWNTKEKAQYGQCYYWAPPRGIHLNISTCISEHRTLSFHHMAPPHMAECALENPECPTAGAQTCIRIFILHVNTHVCVCTYTGTFVTNEASDVIVRQQPRLRNLS